MMKDDEFLRIAVYMKEHYGIDLGQKKVIMNGRLENYIKRGGWGSFHDFMDDLQKDKSGKFEKELVNLLTTNYTYFMREFQHFEFFKREVLPWAKNKAAKTKDLRVWCGAASTGEEPYMIAMVIRDFFGLDFGSWDTKVLATDVSTRALQQAIAGVYNEEALAEMPQQWKKRFFQNVGNDMFAVTDELKQEVLFRQFNLMSPFPFKKKMHTVFLRNVMIYFDAKTKQELLQKVYDSLEPGGYLFIGMTETLDRNQTPFQIIQPSIFRKKEG
ncbi:MAG: protein-glutamate O-methyltransferase CheR [Lachnospiraceae bacterium]|nr:protein-glutamate O-methyltransferase CheR [Lachnospiraceae bacterium]